MRSIFALWLTCLLSVTLALPAAAQSKKELSAADAALALRLDTLEQRYLTGDPAAERLMQRMDSLEASQRALTGEIEQLRYERDSLTKDLKGLASDIATMQALSAEMRQHLDAVELAAQPRSANVAPVYSQPSFTSQPSEQSWQEGATSPSAPAASGSLGTNTVDMSELKNIGQQKLMAGDFTGAQLAYKQYIEINPAADDIGDAYFWLAETYFVKSGFSEAVDAYIASMRAAPDGSKAPNAMIGLAASLRGLGDSNGACQTLDGFPVQFPAAAADIRQKVDIERQRAGCS